MKEFIITLKCHGFIEPKQINIKALSIEEARTIAQKQFPNCTIISIDEYLKS